MPENLFAQRLDYLFQTVKKPDGREYSYQDVADGLDPEIAGHNASYIWKLRTGKIANPGMKTIQALATFFNVDPSYFFTEDEGAAQNAALPNGLRNIALRASDLNEAEQAVVLDMIESIKCLKKKRQQT
jgi:transcriptional regulator with XRE-family HTH domain